MMAERLATDELQSDDGSACVMMRPVIHLLFGTAKYGTAIAFGTVDT